MKRLATITVFALTAALLAPPPALLQAAQAGPKPKSSGITMPVTGSGPAAQFAGTFNLTRFAATDTGVVAVGMISGTLVDDALGTVTTVVRNVAIPVQIGGGPAQAAPAAAQISALAICDVLHLELGPLDLDLLGVVVHLDRVVLDIDAVSAPGNLLGNLLCALLGLLDSGAALGQIAQLLNDILAILA